MSTIGEIESAIERLPPEKVEAVFLWLQARKEKVGADVKSSSDKQSASGKPGGFPLFGVLEGKIIYHQGWDEPLEDFRPYME